MPKSKSPAEVSAPNDQEEFIDDPAFYVDPYGQMTINKIDSEIGILCQGVIAAEMAIETAKTNYEGFCKDMMDRMQKEGVKKIKVLGRTIVFQDAKLSEPKIIIKDQA